MKFLRKLELDESSSISDLSAIRRFASHSLSFLSLSKCSNVFEENIAQLFLPEEEGEEGEESNRSWKCLEELYMTHIEMTGECFRNFSKNYCHLLRILDWV